MLLELLPDAKRAVPAGRTLPPAPKAADPIPAEFLLHALSVAMGPEDVLVEEVAIASTGHAEIHADARPGQFLHHGERRPRLQPARRGRHGAGTPGARTVCLIGDGSAMYSIQALWTAAQRKLPLTVVVINNSGYGAMRSFSQVMQVRNVPGLELPGIDFVKLAEGMGCHAVRVTKSSELAGALSRGLSHDGTSLIEVMVDSAVPLLYAQKT